MHSADEDDEFCSVDRFGLIRSEIRFNCTNILFDGDYMYYARF